MDVFSMLHIQEKTSMQNFQALAREGLWLLFSAFDSRVLWISAPY